MKRITTLIALFMAASALMAQPKISVETQQKLGDISFQTPKTVTFRVKNTGNKPLVIKEVQPSCGCVSVNFSTAAIAPGKQSAITAVYDAAMMGTFYRELAIYSNASPEPLYVGFRGRVVETLNAEDFAGDYPVDLGFVRLNTNAIEFNDVNKGDRPVAELMVANTGDEDYTPQLMHLPPYLEAECFPRTIRKGRAGKVRIMLHSDKLMLDGLNQTSIYIGRYPGDRISEKTEVVVSAVLLPPLANLTAEQMEKAPQVVVMDGDSLVNDRVRIPLKGRKKKLEKTLLLTNIGESPLTIQAVQVFNRALGVRLSDRVIPAHGVTKLRVTVDTRELAKAKAQTRVLIISNDPRRAKMQLDISTYNP